MTVMMKDDVFSMYRKYVEEDNIIFGKFINSKLNYILVSIMEEVKIIEKKQYESISEDDINNIVGILMKLSLIARIDLIKCMESIKEKDLSFIKQLKYSKQLIDYSLKIIVRLLINIKNENIDFDNIEALKNNDSISHSNRVFFNIIKFIKYYNDSINNNLVLDVRNNFKDKYLKYYKNIFKKFHIKKNISQLEHVYKHGLREILFNEIVNISIAAFWYDIVNLKALNECSNMKCYSYLKHFIKYNDEVSLIVGLHNEYYGHGHGIFLNYYNSVINRKPFLSPNYVISFDYNDALKLSSISYFPSKVLEIVNLFDNIVYSNKEILDYKKALEVMKENYLDKDVKIDPIIFDVFSSFVLKK